MRILGSTILDRSKGFKYHVEQIIEEDTCRLVITTLTEQQTGVVRIKQVDSEVTCRLKITEVQ